MPLFKYRAVDADGNSIDGTMEGPFAHEVVVALQQKGMAVNAVRPVGRQKPPTKSKPLTWHDLGQLNSQLVMATRSSLPLAPSLAAMGEDLGNQRVKVVLDDVRRHLESGNSLQSALERHPGAFSPVYRALVAAGERAGDLPRVFKTLANYSTSMMEVKSSIQIALAYPIMVVVFAIVLLSGLMIKVVPEFEAIFTDFGGRLPAPTRLLMSISHFFTDHIALILAGAVAGLIIFAFAIRRRDGSGSYWRDWLRMKTPVSGRMYMRTSVMHFIRALSMLLQAHAPLLESLELAAAAAGNAVLQRRVRYAARDISAGLSLSHALQKANIFDSGSMWLLANGEKNGNIEEVLEVLADESGRSLQYLYRSFTVILGPALVIALGFAVAFVLVGLYLPVFTLGDIVSGS